MRDGTLAMLRARHNHPKAQQGVLLLRNGWAQVEGVGSKKGEKASMFSNRYMHTG